MDTETSLKWIEENNLLSFIKPHIPVFRRVLAQCLNAHEEVLLIGDTGFKNNNLAALLSAGYYLAANELSLKTKLILQEYRPRLESASYKVVDALDALAESNIIIVNQSDKVGKIRHLGKSFRKFASMRKHKFISTSSLGYVPNGYISQIVEAFDVDYEQLRIAHNRIKDTLNAGSRVHIKTERGTDVEMSIGGRSAIASDGNFTVPGKGGNLPAGEVYIPPVEESINGTIVIDASSRNLYKTEIVREPITLIVKNGRIVDIHGGVEADILDQSLRVVEEHAKHPERVRIICELGIGLNPKARVIGTTIIDEKVLGTAHFGIGSNVWFGGANRTIVHLDQVFNNPKIFVDGKLLELTADK